MKVRAKEKGFYGQLRQPGDVFDCPANKVGSWMEVIEPVVNPVGQSGKTRPVDQVSEPDPAPTADQKATRDPVPKAKNKK